MSDQTTAMPDDQLEQLITAQLQQMQEKYEHMATDVLDKIDNMADKINTLEESIQQLIEQAQLDEEALKQFQAQQQQPPSA